MKIWISWFFFFWFVIVFLIYFLFVFFFNAVFFVFFSLTIEFAGLCGGSVFPPLLGPDFDLTSKKFFDYNIKRFCWKIPFKITIFYMFVLFLFLIMFFFFLIYCFFLFVFLMVFFFDFSRGQIPTRSVYSSRALMRILFMILIGIILFLPILLRWILLFLAALFLVL